MIMMAEEIETTTKPSSPGPNNDGATLVGHTSPSANGDGGGGSVKEKLRQQKLRQRRAKLRRLIIPLLLYLPHLLGLLWTTLHPLVSIITGELKCRGKYIDENGLDVHRHRVRNYPLERTSPPALGASLTSGEGGGMCHAIHSFTNIMSPSVECLRHQATETIAFDIVRILPAMGPVIESAEAVVLVVGGNKMIIQGQNDNINNNDGNDDWYERSDLNASILHMIKKLGNKEDCPWLTKVVYIVSPVALSDKYTDNNAIITTTVPSLEDTVDAFLASYLGGGGSHSNKGSPKAARAVHPLPPDFTFPMIRSVLVVNDVTDVDKLSSGGDGSGADTSSRTQVRILPQGTAGTLPNLDLVFATLLSLQSYPAGDRYTPLHSIYYSESSEEFRVHPFGSAWESMEERLSGVLVKVTKSLGLGIEKGVRQYVKDLMGLFGFVVGMVIGPRQPHDSALNHGIDALTIEVRIPSKSPDNLSSASSSTAIHPHYADLTRCLEHLLRSISNLHERLHHSITQYTMPSPSKFVSHGEYVYPALLVSLPMIVRAASLALRDVKRFQFLHAGAVLMVVCTSTLMFGIITCGVGSKQGGENNVLSEWIARVTYFILSLFVVSVARLDKSHLLQCDSTSKRTQQTQSDIDECRKSLWFTACLVGIYLHAPLLLANYSLGFPSSAFWSPLLATLILPSSIHKLLSRNGALSKISEIVKCSCLMAISPPVLLVPRIFPAYTAYVIGVYTPLHFLLTSLWLA